MRCTASATAAPPPTTTAAAEKLRSTCSRTRGGKDFDRFSSVDAVDDGIPFVCVRAAIEAGLNGEEKALRGIPSRRNVKRAPPVHAVSLRAL